MKTRILHTKFWNDSFVSSLSPEEKLVFNYYLTNDKINIIHFYECSDRLVLFETGVSTGVLQGCKGKLSNAKKILFFNDFVFIVNAYRYERYEGPDNVKAKERTLNQLSKECLSFYKEHTPLSTGVYTPTINHKSKIINDKSETINHNSQEQFKKIRESLKGKLRL